MCKAKAVLLVCLVGVLAFLSSCAKPQVLPLKSHPSTDADDGWRDLFAEDLSNGVYKPGGWVMEKGVLCCKGGGDIWTKEKFADFILDLEFKTAKGANSGIFLRLGPEDVSHNSYRRSSGIELQVSDSYGWPDVPKEQRTNRSLMCGLVFIDPKLGFKGSPGHAYFAPTRNMVNKPGQWNRYTITCKGSKLYVVLNGEQINNLDLYWWAEGHKNPNDGKYPKKYKVEDMPLAGHIGLQYHGQPVVCYRNIKIKTL